MVRTASAAAVLVFAAGLAHAASGQTPPADAAASIAVPIAVAQPGAPAAPALPSISEIMRAQAQADAPPPPPPPPPPIAAPSVAVAAEPLAPAAKAASHAAFAPPPASAVEAARAAPASAAPPAVQVAAAEPVALPLQPVTAPLASPAAPALVKAVVVAPTPVVAAAPAPRAPEANAFVAHRVTDAAGAFDAWTEKAARIDGRFADAHGVSAALADASAVQADQLEEGAVAYGALAALQDPVFVQSAHDLAAIGGDHDAAAAILLKDPSQVMTLPGADGAASFAAESLSKRALAVTTAGKAVRQAAYSMQTASWARDPVSGADKRLADAKARSSTVIALDGPASGLLMKRLVELRTSRQSRPALAGRAAPTPLVTRSLALAAMIVLGEADEAHAPKLTPLLVEPKSSDCLKLAKLNLFQCLSVAGPHYEDAFCIGEHGLGEAGQCLASATGVSVAAPVVATAPVLVAAAAPAPSAGIAVPIALLSETGPERTAAFAAAPPAAPPPVVVPPAPPPAPVETAAPILLAQAAPAPQAPAAPAYEQPRWAREAAPPPQAYARQEDAPAAPRYDRGRAYLWDRQARSADYVAPGYASPYGYADPRQGYGRYAQPSRPAYDPSDDEDDGPAPPPRAYPQRSYWNDR